MPKLVATGDDGTVKFIGLVTKVSDPVTDPDNPDIETYTVTAEAFGTDAYNSSRRYSLRPCPSLSALRDIEKLLEELSMEEDEVQLEVSDDHLMLVIRRHEDWIGMSWPEANRLQYRLRQACVEAGLTVRGM